MNTCIDINRLEHYAFETTQGRVLDQTIQSHLDQCGFCREHYEQLVEQFQSTEQQFSKISETLIDNVAKRFQTKPQYPFVLEARYMRDQTADSWQNQIRSTRAADSGSPGRTSRYQSGGTLSTADGQLIVRLMIDTQIGNTSLHLIAEDVEKIRQVPVHIAPIDMETVTDSNGRADLGNTQLPPLEDLKVSVHTPRAVFDLSVLEMNWKELVGQGEILIQNQARDRMYIEFQPEGENYRLSIRLDTTQVSQGIQKVQVLASKESGSHQLGRVKKGIAVFHDITEAPQLRIKVFG